MFERLRREITAQDVLASAYAEAQQVRAQRSGRMKKMTLTPPEQPMMDDESMMEDQKENGEEPAPKKQRRRRGRK